MAQMVAKAMARSDKADAEQKATIDKLSVEFAEELEGLNVRVTKLEKNSSTVKVTGEARLRYEDMSADRAGTENDNFVNTLKLRTRIHLNGQINDQWGYYGRLQSENNMRGDVGGSNDTVTMHNVYVKGALFGTTTTIGRFDYVPNFGLIMDGRLNGVKVGFGNALKTELYYGKQQDRDLWGEATQPNLGVIAGTLKYDTSKATTLNGGYYQFKDSEGTVTPDEDTMKVWEVGFRTQLAADWALKGSYAKSDADEDNKAYFAEIGYKGADKKKVGSYGAWVGYRDLEASAAPRPTFDGKWAENSGLNGGKGYEVGFNYTPALNTVLRVKYVDMKKSFEGADDTKSKFLQAQAEFFF
ncbi:MAG: S-layer protein [Pelosinus sp.]|nr:S-layer protein [Pelosinus sp.]